MTSDSAKRTPFRLETLVDFVDDAIAAEITPAHVDAMMGVLKEAGIERVSWGYYGDGHGGYFIPAGLNEGWGRYEKTLRALGNPLRVAVEAAHRHGIELYAYFKPYETGPGLSLPEGTPEARAFGRLRQQGGWLTWLDRFVVDHPALRIRHRPDASIEDLSDVPICALKLIKADDAPTRVSGEHLQIWSSQHNYRYQQCDVDFVVEENVEASVKDVRDVSGALVTRLGDPVRTLTLAGFELTDPYVMVTTDFAEGPADFRNTGTDLLVALDAEGREIPGVFATGGGIWERASVDFRNWGLHFDMGRGQSVIHLDEPNESGQKGLIAFTRGRNEYLPGALCETEPQVQSYWLSCLREILDAGVDGVDFRVENHGTHSDYTQEYGFNDVILEECDRRGQRDLATISQVRGEAYTRFLQDSRQMITASGKRMRINLNIDWFRPEPPPPRRLAYPANIQFEWQRWVDEGLMDEGILRIYQLPFDAVFDDDVSAAMIARCQQQGIPLTVNRYINPEYGQEFERVRGDGRFSGFILYETAGFLKFDEDGGCRLSNDTVAEVCQMMKDD